MKTERTELEVSREVGQIEKAAVRAVRERPDYVRYVRDYFAWVRENDLGPAEGETLKRYIRSLEGRYTGGSFQPILAALKNGLRGAARSLLSAQEAAIVSEALRSVKAPRRVNNAVRRDFLLSPREEKKVLDEMTDRDGLLFQFLMKTGARISEALNIRLSEAKTDGEMVELPIRGKGGKLRTLRVASELFERIRGVYRGEAWLFETEAGKPVHRSYAYRRISKAVREAAGKKFSPHGCRHTFATRVIEKTGKIKAVSDYLGHSSTAITLDLYTHEGLTDAELAGL